METYLSIKKESGRDGDFSGIDNETVLASYGITLPEKFGQQDSSMQENNGEQEEEKHLLNGQSD